MNTIWSDYIQGIGTLYLTRKLRFSDVFRDKYKQAFCIDDKKSILEIGCGPGALLQSLHRWYNHAEVFGIDRDSQFIEFARKELPSVCFMEDDATKLSFDDESFDVTISNTVQEHIEPSKFFGEQYRVLKQNGVCLVLSARRGINIVAPCIAEKTELEAEIYKRTEKIYELINKAYNVCAYPLSEMELPTAMEKYGFRNVSVDYVSVNLTPDNPEYSTDFAHAMINANRQVELDNVESLSGIAQDIVTKEEIEELKVIKNKKYDKRIELYEAGIKQWDTNMSVIMILRGVK